MDNEVGGNILAGWCVLPPIEAVGADEMRREADVGAAFCAAIFIAVLGVAAYWDRSIRALHFWESLLYCATAILCLRQIKFGYALGVASGAFWLWMAGFLTTFIRN